MKINIIFRALLTILVKVFNHNVPRQSYVSNELIVQLKSVATPIAANYYLSKRDYNASYINFPILANVEIYSRKTFHNSLVMRVSFNQIINYHIDSYYLCSPCLTGNITDKQLGLGTTSKF